LIRSISGESVKTSPDGRISFGIPFENQLDRYMSMVSTISTLQASSMYFFPTEFALKVASKCVSKFCPANSKEKS